MAYSWHRKRAYTGKERIPGTGKERTSSTGEKRIPGTGPSWQSGIPAYSKIHRPNLGQNLGLISTGPLFSASVVSQSRGQAMAGGGRLAYGYKKGDHQLRLCLSELRSCVKVEVDVLGSRP